MKKQFMPSKAQAKIYVELRQIKVPPKKALSWVKRRVTKSGKIKRK